MYSKYIDRSIWIANALRVSVSDHEDDAQTNAVLYRNRRSSSSEFRALLPLHRHRIEEVQ
jgi:hypothetical protein